MESVSKCMRPMMVRRAEKTMAGLMCESLGRMRSMMLGERGVQLGVGGGGALVLVQEVQQEYLAPLEGVVETPEDAIERLGVGLDELLLAA